MLIAFIAGLMIGGMFGVGIMCLCIAAGRADNALEDKPPNSPTI